MRRLEDIEIRNRERMCAKDDALLIDIQNFVDDRRNAEDGLNVDSEEV